MIDWKHYTDKWGFISGRGGPDGNEGYGDRLHRTLMVYIGEYFHTGEKVNTLFKTYFQEFCKL